jgi:hypothetical protein
MLNCHPNIFSGGLSVQASFNFLDWLFTFLLSFKIYLYILDDSPLLDMYFTKIFLAVSFAEVCIFNEVQFIKFFFHRSCFFVLSKKPSASPGSSKFSPLLYCGAGDGTQVLGYSRQTPYHWATPPALLGYLLGLLYIEVYDPFWISFLDGLRSCV